MRWLSCHKSDSIKALKGTRNNDRNQKNHTVASSFLDSWGKGPSNWTRSLCTGFLMKENTNLVKVLYKTEIKSVKKTILACPGLPWYAFHGYWQDDTHCDDDIPLLSTVFNSGLLFGHYAVTSFPDLTMTFRWINCSTAKRLTFHPVSANCPRWTIMLSI